MKVLKFTILFAILTVGFLGEAAVKCETDSYTNGKSDGIVVLDVGDSGQYYNGIATFTGRKLIRLFADEMKRLNAHCYSEIDSGEPTCQIPGRIDMAQLSLFTGGRFESGFTGFPDSNGMKIISTFDGKANGKDWYFNRCVRL